MKLRIGMVVKIKKIIKDEEKFKEYINKIGIIKHVINFSNPSIEVVICDGSFKSISFYSTELEILNQSNIFRRCCYKCNHDIKKVLTELKQFNKSDANYHYYCPKCLM